VSHEFFRAKRPWSRYKDFILSYYLDPYIPKVATLKKPILIVDCFAGCGTFGDDEPGSPLIISRLVEKWRGKGVDVRAEFIEADPDNFRSLERCLHPFAGFATARHGSFEAHLPDLAARARQNTVFLYVDPYTVKGLVFDRMRAVYDQIRTSSASVELLLNLNVVTFFRWGLSVVKQLAGLPPEEASEADYLADDPTEDVEMATLDAIAGGGYWRDIALDPAASFQQKIERFTEAYLGRLVQSFTYAISYEVKEKYEHRVPKYALIYATRHPDGVELMNDGMCKARLEFLGSRFVANRLFDCTPEEEVPDTGRLKADLLAALAVGKRLTRKELRLEALRHHFGLLQTKDINAAVGELLKAGRLFSSTGKPRINDEVVLSATPFGSSVMKPTAPRPASGG
jgi:three-Cys-motif partner protein